MSASAADPLIELAERVASIAAELGIATAVIGATALAAHNYVRGTADIDLATAVDPFQDLGKLRDRLADDGFHTELNMPDADDSLGGVLRVRARDEEDDPVEIVNFHNPLRPSHNPGAEAVQLAFPIGLSSPLRCATLQHLIALKLYAGGRRDQADVVELLRRNPSADRSQIRDVCARYGSATVLDQLLREV
jgi:hypothetical protein